MKAIAGTVVEVAESRTRPHILFVDVAENDSRITCGMLLEKTKQAMGIEVGDLLVFDTTKVVRWTPASEFDKRGGSRGVAYDIPLKRVGVAGQPHPDRQTA